MRSTDSLRRILRMLLLLLPVAAAGAEAASITAVDYLGSVYLPRSQNGVSGIGGLSDLAYDPVAGHWVLLSDEARAFSMDLDLADGRLDTGDAVITAELPLRLSGSDDDPEGIDIGADGSWWVSTEGNANKNDAAGGGYEPFVARLDPTTGNVAAALPLPTQLVPLKPDASTPWGIRHNRGLEGVALTPDGRGLYTAAEEGLSQEPYPGTGGSRLTRIIEYDLVTAAEVAQYPYLLDGVGLQNGLVALLSLGSGKLLALERAVGFLGFDIRLFEVDLTGASDVSGLGDMAVDFAGGVLTAADKRELLRLSSLGLIFDNVEGLAFGPWNGLQRTLLMVADDGDTFSNSLLAAFNLTFDAVFPPPAPAPAPATLALLLGGLALLGAGRRRSGRC